MTSPGVCQSIAEKRRKKDGCGTLANPEKLYDQDFHKLKQYCMERNLRYIDGMFAPDQNSVGKVSLSPSDLARIEWLRPGVCGFLIHLF